MKHDEATVQPAPLGQVERGVGRLAPERASACGLTECAGKPMCPRCVVVNAPPPKFRRGDLVRKRGGSQWQGRVVGEYSTTLTPEGYAVESDSHAGSVQIYPAAALELLARHEPPNVELSGQRPERT